MNLIFDRKISLRFLIVLTTLIVLTLFGVKNFTNKPQPESNQNIFPHARFEIEKKDFKVNEQVKLRLKLNSNNSSIKSLIKQAIAKDYPVDKIVLRTDFQTELENPPITTSPNGSGDYEINIDTTKNFRPGRYFVDVTLTENNQTRILTQDFTYGVLAINTNKSIFTPGETAYLQLASLDNTGHTFCNAPLELEITSPNKNVSKFSVKQESIQKNSTCGADNVTDSPDYYLYYKVEELGNYTLKLHNADINIDSSISDNFEVQETVPFIVEREGATRINPFKAEYTMKIKVTANQDFEGDIVETVPSDFAISPSKDPTLYPFPFTLYPANNRTREIVWKAKLTKGQQLTLGYAYQAPKISPQLFLLGPLRFFTSEVKSKNTSEVFAESRQWQIASDAACSSNGTGGGNWGTGSSWAVGCTGTNGVPGSGDTVTIASGDTITGNSTTSVLSITISSSGILTFSGQSPTVTLTATSGTLLANSGTYTLGTETIVMNPDADITTTSGAITLYNLQLTPTITANRTYTMGSTAITINNNFDINPTKTGNPARALTVNMGANITVTGTTTVTATGGKASSTFDAISFLLTTGKMVVGADGSFLCNSSGGDATFTGTSGTILAPTGTYDCDNSTANKTLFNIDANGVTLWSGTPLFGVLTFSPTLTDNRVYNLPGAVSVDNFNVTPSSASNYSLTVNLGGTLTQALSTLNISGSGAGPATAILDTTSNNNYSMNVKQINIGSNGTLTANNSTITSTAISTAFTRTGTFNAGTSTVVINPDVGVTLTSGAFTGSNAFYNLSLTPTITVNRTYTFAAGAIEVSNNFTINPTAATALRLTVNLGSGGLTVGGTTTITGTTSGVSTLYTTDANNAPLTSKNITIASAGTLDPAESTISVSGDFTKTGTFSTPSGAGTFTITGTGTSTLTGATTFQNFTSTAAGKTIKFGNGSIFTIAGTFTLTGTSGSKINLQSDSNGVQWKAQFSSAQTGSTYVNVQDSGCDSGTSTITLSLADSTNVSGNDTSCWIFSSVAVTAPQVKLQGGTTLRGGTKLGQ